MIELTTRYLGLALRNPLVASASPLTGDIGSIRQLEDNGAAAVVLPSIFEEQIRAEVDLSERMLGAGAESYQEVAARYFPEAGADSAGLQRHLDLIRRSREAVCIPVIASLNGVSNEGWIEHARCAQQAGASALELNIYYLPLELHTTGQEAERHHMEMVTAIRRAVTVPVAVKLNPYFSAFGHMALELERAGADALVLFNRLYHPDIDLVRLQLQHRIELSRPLEMRLALLWLAVLHGHVTASLAATTGVETADEVIKYLLAGADVVMTASALLRHGVSHMRRLLEGLESWLDAREFGSVGEIRGMMSQGRLREPEAAERAHYIETLQAYRPIVSDAEFSD